MFIGGILRCTGEVAVINILFLSCFSFKMSRSFQGTNNQLALLEKMNHRVAEEYNNNGDVASGLRVFVEQLNEKNQRFGEYTSQIDAIDKQVTEFEAVVSMLDKHVSLLEKKVKSAYHIAPTQWFIPKHCNWMAKLWCYFLAFVPACACRTRILIDGIILKTLIMQCPVCSSDCWTGILICTFYQDSNKFSIHGIDLMDWSMTCEDSGAEASVTEISWSGAFSHATGIMLPIIAVVTCNAGPIFDCNVVVPTQRSPTDRKSVV